jgi:hypothetical protein
MESLLFSRVFAAMFATTLIALAYSGNVVSISSSKILAFFSVIQALLCHHAQACMMLLRF